MKFNHKYLALLFAGLVACGNVFVACDDDDDYNTDQMGGGVSLTAAQLQVTRGAYMQFKGTNLNQITSIVFPENVTVSTIEVVDAYTIRCIVPEEAMPGTVKLYYGDSFLETGTIAFTEPITFESFAPTTAVTPGDQLTITGTYLNYITQVQFATGDPVAIDNTNRTEFKVTVPVDASSGEFTIGYAYEEDGETLINELPSPAELIVNGPTDIALASTTIKAGDNAVITGSLLRLVEYVVFSGGDTAVWTPGDPTKDVESITVPMPVTAVDGPASLVLYSGLTVETPAITCVVPTVAIKDPADSYGIGSKVVLAGENLDLVAQTAFKGNTKTAAVVYNTDGNIEMTVDSSAQSGDIDLVLLNGDTVKVAGFVTTKPVVTLPTETVTALDELTITSTLPGRVKQVLFGEAVATATKITETTFDIQVPLDAIAGSNAITIVMDNGETVAAGTVSVGSYSFCAVSEFLEDEVVAGNLYLCHVVNSESLVKVTIKGEECQFITDGDKLYVSTTSRMGGNVQMVLISDDGTEVPYTIYITPATEIRTTLWSGAYNIGSWGAMSDLSWSGYDWTDVPVGAELVINFTEDASQTYWQIRAGNGSWTALPGTADVNNLEKGATSFSLTITDSIKTELVNNGGLVVTGAYLIIASVELVETISLETTINLASGKHGDSEYWTFPVALDWSSGKRFVIYKDNPEDISSLVKVGATLRFYVTGKTGQIQINDAKWNKIQEVSNWDEATAAEVYEVSLTQAYVDAFNKGDGWSSAWLIIQGSGFTITKVTLE